MTTPTFRGATPIFCVEDGAAALAWYRDKLGFEIAWQWSDDQAFDGGHPTFACVCRGDVSLFLGEKRQGNPGTWLMVGMETPAEVDALHDELTDRGVAILEPPQACSWGMYEMWVEDPDGNTFRFGAPVSD